MTGNLAACAYSQENTGEFSRKCTYHEAVAAELEDDEEADDYDDVDDAAVVVKPVLPPRQTALTLARKV